MVAKTLRAAIFTSLMLVLWTFARPAGAATLAPFCDDRGATALAPAPALEATDEAVRRAAAPPDCDVMGTPVRGLSVGHARPRVSAEPAEVTPVQTPASLRLVAPAGEPLDVVVRASSLLPQPGVRFRVERPPRG
jgi:hypothetical protein